MKLNIFIWDNYKQTEGGKKAIQDFAERKPENLLVNYGGYSETEKQELKDEITDLLLFTSKPEFPKNLTPSSAEALFDEIIREGITLTFENGESETLTPSSDGFLGIISFISTWLYHLYPDYFKPYYFT